MNPSRPRTQTSLFAEETRGTVGAAAGAVMLARMRGLGLERKEVVARGGAFPTLATADAQASGNSSSALHEAVTVQACAQEEARDFTIGEATEEVIGDSIVESDSVGSGIGAAGERAEAFEKLSKRLLLVLRGCAEL